MSLKIGELAAAMTGAAKDSLAKDWPKVRDYARPEFKKLAQSVKDIVRLAVEGKVSAAEAKSLLRIHRNTALIVMLTVEGLGVLAAEKAINAALGAVADVINAAAPFRIV